MNRIQPNYTPVNKTAFTQDNVERFPIDHGAFAIWDKSYLCPCRQKSTNAPKQNCKRCHGVGFAFAIPTSTLVLLQSQDKGVLNGKDIGLALTGGAIGTVPRESLVTYRDRLTFPDNIIPQSLLVYVTKESIKEGIFLRYSVQKVLFAATDTSEIPPSSIRIHDSFYYPDESLVGSYVTLNLLVTLRYYVVNVLRESRYQYHVGVDPRKPKAQRGRIDLPRKLLLRREDMFVPEIISGEGADYSIPTLDDINKDAAERFDSMFER